MVNTLGPETVINLREALCELPDVIAKEDLSPPEQEELYVPGSHTKALGLDATIVVGMRGAGKSVWTAALFDSRTRNQLTLAGAPRVLGQTHVRVGYSVDNLKGEHPGAEVLRSLFEQIKDPRHIWRAILARHVADVCGLEFPPGHNKTIDAARWAQDDPEAFERLLADGSHILKERGEYLLLVFDALDTLPGGWKEVRLLARGALEVALACRSYPAIRLKFFLRPDMEEDPEILNFRDSSKLLHNRVELRWRPVDLYGLVFHILANGSAGEPFRKLGERHAGVHWEAAEGIHYLPEKLRGNEEAQRPLIQRLAGPYMGTDKRRGHTYTWIPTHLADAHGRIAPRSLLLALREAAKISKEQYADYPYPLHYEAIKKGVAEASQQRVHELSREDYPWVEPLLNRLRGITVPLAKEELVHYWPSSVLEEVMNKSEDKLPPRRYSSAYPENRSIDLLIDDLEELGVLYRTEDERINIPDIFRVGFEIRRKGGVRPPTRNR